MKRKSIFENNNTSRFSVSKSYDDGEILTQSKSITSRNEYTVQSSITDIPFEEYVVKNVAPTVMQQSVDVNLFYTPSQTYNTEPVYAPAVTSFTNDNEKLSLLDNITQQNNKINSSPSNANNTITPSTQSSFEYLDTLDDVSKSASANEDDFAKDMQAILTGQKVFDPVTNRTVDKSSLGAATQQSQHKETPTSLPAIENKHAIFDQIAQSMEYAKAYDLGSIDLEKRFSDFDRINDLQNAALSKKSSSTPQHSVKTSNANSTVNSEDFIKDLDAIAKAASINKADANAYTAHQFANDNATTTIPAAAADTNTASPNWPPRPTNIRPLTAQERAQLYGTFPYVADPSTFNGDGIRVTNDWRTQNIVAVSIPQLNGKLIDGHAITNGTINFHKAGATALQNLWLAWQNAGLLDRIINFQGGYAARYIRNSQSRNPRPLSNHAWGTAFDINANWNAYGAQPALVGQQGCVRELVSIANQHGFFWGGHFRTNLDGMHFELGKTIN